jgi:hypothetical protein
MFSSDKAGVQFPDSESFFCFCSSDLELVAVGSTVLVDDREQQRDVKDQRRRITLQMRHVEQMISKHYSFTILYSCTNGDERRATYLS